MLWRYNSAMARFKLIPTYPQRPHSLWLWALVALWATLPAILLFVLGAGPFLSILSLAISWAGAAAYMRARRAEIALTDALIKAKQHSEAKSRFLATVSHEIRTPMNGIVGMTKLLEDTELTAEQRSYTEAVGFSSAALMVLIEDLLDFSKIEAGRIDIEKEWIELRPFSELLLELLASKAFEKDLGLSLYVDAALPQSLETDPKHLRQILINLLGNAIKFTAQGHVQLRLEKIGHDLAITVQDTGPGLSQADQSRIFDEFEQADTSSKRAHGGAGLGLAISRKLSHALKGQLTLESTLGEGSAFTLCLPMGEQNSAQPIHPTLKGKKCLIWMHDHSEAEALCHDLSQLGAQTMLYGSASPLNGDFDFSFLDSQMLENGETPESALDKMGLSAGRHCVLIPATERGRVENLLALGFSAYLVRPMRFATLTRIAQKLLNDSLIVVDAPYPAHKTLATAKNQASMIGLNVLVAEDNAVNALLVRATLTRYGHKVTVVSNGRLAIEAHQEEHFDMILMDLHMPEMDGPEAIAHIRSTEEAVGQRRTPILVLTADGQESTRQKMLSFGADGFLTKPIDPAGLVVAVESSISA